jgi:hypothetical protein
MTTELIYTLNFIMSIIGYIVTVPVLVVGLFWLLKRLFLLIAAVIYVQFVKIVVAPFFDKYIAFVEEIYKDAGLPDIVYKKSYRFYSKKLLMLTDLDSYGRFRTKGDKYLFLMKLTRWSKYKAEIEYNIRTLVEDYNNELTRREEIRMIINKDKSTATPK